LEESVPESKDQVEVPKSPESPLVFISHDGRDADLAEAFSKLLKSVSAGMLKSFRSSDKRGTEGIEFGDEWYKTLMSKLDIASDVVCLLTERSLDRPWILYEAGVAKGKLGTPVHGIALGVPLSRVSAGPFYQFQNSDDSEESVAKLILQLCRRIPSLEPDKDVVLAQVKVFKASASAVLVAIGGQKKNEKKDEKKDEINEGAVAKVLEEMKLIVRELPVRLEERMGERTENPRPRRFSLRRLHPRMLEEMIDMVSGRSGEPIGILVIASLMREDFPWLYEIGLDAYRTAKRGNLENTQRALRAFRDATEFTVRGPFFEEMGYLPGKEGHMLFRELPQIIHDYTERSLLRLTKRSRSEKAATTKE
jgi:hypothetical protein